MQFKIKKGLDIPLSGTPDQQISDSPGVSSVASLGPDTHDLKPGMLVRQGDRVRLGQPLYIDKANPGVHFTAPACGTVAAINRGERRVLQSVVIKLDGDDAESFDTCAAGRLRDLTGDDVRRNLQASGLWTAQISKFWKG